jgi:hypothetical protein
MFEAERNLIHNKSIIKPLLNVRKRIVHVTDKMFLETKLRCTLKSVKLDTIMKAG